MLLDEVWRRPKRRAAPDSNALAVDFRQPEHSKTASGCKSFPNPVPFSIFYAFGEVKSNLDPTNPERTVSPRRQCSARARQAADPEKPMVETQPGRRIQIRLPGCVSILTIGLFDNL